MSEPKSQSTPEDLFGHPRGLTILFTTEMWEVFSFVGMKTMLVYYMTQQLAFRQEDASLIYGAYSGTAYFLPIIGGVLCDRWLGRRNSVILGGSLMALGHFLLFFESFFFPALCLVALGAGFYLPALPSQIGALYQEGDPRRASAYNVYYVGMNLGAFLAPLVCGTLGELFGWHWGFAVAGVGMLLGVVIYTAGSRHLPSDEPRERVRTRQSTAFDHDVMGRFGLIIAVAAIVVLYRGAFEQIGNTVAFWLDRGVDRRMGDWVLPMTWFQSLNPLLIFVLTPLLMTHWTRRARRVGEPSLINRMAIGALLGAVAYLVLAAASADASVAGQQPNWLWVAGFIFVLTISELFIMPVCLGLFSRLAPPGFTATAMSMFFLTGFGGHFLAGWLGSLWRHFEPSGFFVMIAGIAGVASVLLFAFGLLRRDEMRLASETAVARRTVQESEVAT